MTPFEIDRIPFSKESVTAWAALNRRHTDWPVVYVLDGTSTVTSASTSSDVYVGESRNAAARMRQHLESADKQHLGTLRVDNSLRKECEQVGHLIVKRIASHLQEREQDVCANFAMLDLV